jgi:hypothetical protein
MKLSPHIYILFFLLLPSACLSRSPDSNPALTPVSSPTLVIATNQPAVSTSTLALIPPRSPQSPTQQRTFQPTTLPNSSLKIFSFTVNPTSTVGVNQQVFLSWESSGTSAEICRIGSAGPLGCQPVSPSGSMTLVTDDTASLTSALGLRVYSGQASIWSLVNVLECISPDKWFFDNAPPTCPDGAPRLSRAATQPFQHGFMIWVQAWDTFYVFFSGDQQTFERQSAPYNFRAGASPAYRISDKPPQGLLEPISGFGQIWRGELVGIENARARLGWATAPESSYDTTYQCAVTGASRLWSCYLRGPTGKLLWLRPDSTAGVNLIWNEY